MSGFRLYLTLTGMTIGKFCQQIFLLAGLTVLWITLPVLTGLGAEQTLAQGVSFSSITLAVTAPEGDSVPQLLEKYLDKMTDVRQYCSVRAMEYDEAVAALRQEEVTAILILPEDFVRGIQWGENPDVRVVVNGARPLESMLTLWVGQSACDLLSAVQAGVYAVADLYDQNPPDGLSRSKMLTDINLSYISWTLDRQGMFDEERILPTGSLPIAEHYALCLLSFFALSLAALFSWNYQGSWLTCQKRLGFARRSTLYGFFASLTGSFVVLAAFIFAGLAALSVPLPAALGIALVWAALAAVFAAFCALLTKSAASCGSLSFVIALISLVVAGGVIPPVLLPSGIRRLEWLSPVAWMRDLAAPALDCFPDSAAQILLPAAVLALGALSALLYDRRIAEEVRGR